MEKVSMRFKELTVNKNLGLNLETTQQYDRLEHIFHGAIHYNIFT